MQAPNFLNVRRFACISTRVTFPKAQELQANRREGSSCGAREAGGRGIALAAEHARRPGVRIPRSDPAGSRSVPAPSGGGSPAALRVVPDAANDGRPAGRATLELEGAASLTASVAGGKFRPHFSHESLGRSPLMFPCISRSGATLHRERQALVARGTGRPLVRHPGETGPSQ